MQLELIKGYLCSCMETSCFLTLSKFSTKIPARMRLLPSYLYNFETLHLNHVCFSGHVFSQ